MGLDISYYSGLKLVQMCERKEKWCEDETHFCASGVMNMEFPGRMPPLRPGRCYTFKTRDGFRAGSYGGYNAWRDALARLVGHTSARDVWSDPKPGPFVELINFADNEGELGAVVCTKLAADFAGWHERARTFAETLDAEEGAYWFQQYKRWQAAFECAKNDGAVDFH